MDKITALEAWSILRNGGEIFRISDAGNHQDRFFYQYRDDELYCRVNELGGWNKSIGVLSERYDYYESNEQDEYDDIR